MKTDLIQSADAFILQYLVTEDDREILLRVPKSILKQIDMYPEYLLSIYQDVCLTYFRDTDFIDVKLLKK
jgi:hypothetical protein